MYRHHIFLAFISFLIVSTISWVYELQLTIDLIGNLITFFSIVLGFNLTGLSILFGTNFSKRLAQEEDTRKKTQTKLHTLSAYFNFSYLISIASIVMLLLVNLLRLTADPKQKAIVEYIFAFGFTISWQKLLTATSLGLVTVNIIFMCLLFRLFLKGFIEEGESKHA